MIDGIIKADGTSRLMRATLPATYEEFRAQCAAGTQPLDVLFNALGWSQLPTFLNKGNLQRDTTAALFGKDSNAVPDDLFAWIGQYNEHWWSVLHGQASITYEEEKDAYVIEDGVTYIKQGAIAGTLLVSNSVSVDSSSGAVSLVNPETIALPQAGDVTTFNEIKQKILGKYVSGMKFDEGSIYFLPATTSITVGKVGSYYAMYMTWTTIYKISAQVVNIPAGETTYVHSADRNAYPDSGTVDGLTYRYLGVPFQNAVTAPKIATGSYKGTGKYGASNPNSLTFDFTPKIVIIWDEETWSDSNDRASLPSIYPWGAVTFWARDYGDNTGKSCNASVSGNTMSWYHSGEAMYQLNKVDVKNNVRTITYIYKYIAIG